LILFVFSLFVIIISISAFIFSLEQSIIPFPSLMRPYTLKGLKERIEQHLKDTKVNAVVDIFPIHDKEQFRDLVKQVNDPK
jgi:hypothetical protein